MKIGDLKVLALLCAVCVSVYANTVGNSFQFDDIPGILRNASVHNPLDPVRVFNFWPTRFLNYWSISWNYLLGGEGVFYYHVVQIALHLANSFLLFKLIEALSVAVGLSGGRYAALLGSLLFMVHPVQTQPVNYISQRAVLILSLLYLGSVLLYVKHRLGGGKGLYLASLALAALAVFAKEPIVTLPLMLLALELTVLGRQGLSSGEGLGRRLLRLLPYAAIVAAVSALTVLRRREWGVDFTVVEADAARAGMGVWEYFLTEIAVVKTYLRLFVLPIRQSFDYGYPIYKSFLPPQVFLSALLHLSLVSAAIYSSRFMKLRMFGFGVLWFYIALLAESSFFPIFDVIFEHRMYLPLAGLSMALASLPFLPERPWLRKSLTAALCAVLIVFSVLAVKRNTVWRTEASLWEDALKYAPNKERVRHMLGLAYKKEGRYREAAAEFKSALSQGGNSRQCIRSKYELSEVYFRAGMYEDSSREAKEVLALVYGEIGLDEAGPAAGGGTFKGTPEQEATIKMLSLWSIHTNLGVAYLKKGETDEAIKTFRTAIYLNPGYPEARNQLGLALIADGRPEEAAREFEELLRMHPDFALAHESLGLLYLEKIPDAKKASYHLNRLLRLVPDHPSKDWILSELSKLRTEEDGPRRPPLD